MKKCLSLALPLLLLISPLLKAADVGSATMAASTVPQQGAKPATSISSDTKAMAPDPSLAPPVVDTRYGVFNALDKRSVYGQGAFPEPFLIDDSDAEVNEDRLDWLHTGGPGNQHTDRIRGEVEKGFGLLTLELGAAYERTSTSGEIAEGMDNVEMGARYPFYQYVSRDGDVDNTVGIGMELGVATHTQISHNWEAVPKIFDDLKFQNFTLQSVLGYSTLMGHGGTEGGIQSLEYGFVFGYTIDRDQLAIPGVQQIIPVAELSGARQMNKEDHGDTNLVGDVGFRADLDAIGAVQPRLGIAFVFPVDYGARQDQSWGIDTSLVFEY